MRKLLFTTLYLLTSQLVVAELAVYKSAYRIAGVNNDYGDFIQTDNAGNVYVAGRFANGCDFDPGTGTSTLTLLNGTSDSYIAKYNSTGILQWNYVISGNTESLKGLKVDPSGNIYVYGDFTGSFTANANGTGATFTAVQGSDAFVLKYDATGQLLFSFTYGSDDQDYIQNMAFDTNGDFYIGGEYSSLTLDIDPGVNVRTLTNTNPSGFSYDAYLAKFNSSGTFLWANALQGGLSDYVRGISVDNAGRVLIGGYFSTSLVVDSASGTTLTGVNLGADCYIARYTSIGTYDNAWTFGSTGTDNLLSLTTFNNEIFFTGTFTAPLDLAPGPDTSYVTTNGLGDVFVGKWDANGVLLWGRKVGGSQADLVSLISCNAIGDVYIVGSFIDSAYFDSGLQSSVVRSYGDRDGYIAKYTNQGSYVYAHKIGGISNDYSRGIAFTSNNEYWTSGYYNNSTLYLNPLNPFNTLQNVDLNDAFIVKYGECNYPAVTVQPLSDGDCPGGTASFNVAGTGQNITYQWQEGTNGGTVWTDITNGGVYSGATTTQLTITGVSVSLNNRFYRCVISADCGLSITSGVGILYVTVPNVAVNATSGSLTAVQANATYQWLDCNNGYAIVPGATGQSFNPTVNGNYAAEINLNGCADTSACYQITTAGISSISASEVKLYPVPAGEFLQIELEKQAEYSVSIYDLQGRNLNTKEISFTKDTTLKTGNLPSGTYLLGIRRNGEPLTYFRFIKQ